MTRLAMLLTFTLLLLVFPPASAQSPKNCVDLKFIDQKDGWTTCGEPSIQNIVRFINICNRSVVMYWRNNETEREHAKFCGRNKFYRAIAPGEENTLDFVTWPWGNATIGWCVEWADEPGRCAPDLPDCPVEMTDWYMPAPCVIP